MKRSCIYLVAVLATVCLCLASCSQSGPLSVDSSAPADTTADANTTGTTADGTLLPENTTTAPTDLATSMALTQTTAPTTAGRTTAGRTTAPTETPDSTPISVPNPTVKPTTQATKPLSPAQQKRNQIGFGYYRMGSIADGLLEAIDEEAAKGHINTYMTGMAPYNFNDALIMLHKVKQVGGMTWLGIAETVFLFTQPVRVIDNWKTDLQKMMDTIEEEGLMDSVLGFYFDEPMLCGIDKTDFREATKYLRETWPELRVMTVFAVNAISPDVWSSGNDHPLDYDTGRYLTDAGYDMYAGITENSLKTYQKINNDLKTRLGRSDVRIWYVPCIMCYQSKTDQKYAIDHLEAMYNFLMGEENPGGLLCYAYDISNRDGIGNIGFRELRDRERNPWKTLENWLVYYGKEIQKLNQR